MTLIAVVGMHRSGTSVVARVLNLLGAHLGRPEDLMLPKPDNPKGFWEALTVTQLHDDLLAELGGRWDRPPVLDSAWEYRPTLLSSVERIRSILLTHFASADVTAWKDPRGSFFLPLWRRVVPIEKTILCVRNPEGVARSLSAREETNPEYAAALWLRYMVAAWLNQAEQNLVIDFDEAYERPLELARRLAYFAGLPPPNDEILSEVVRFVDPSLRHSAPGVPAGPVMRLARAAYALIVDGRRDLVTPFFIALSDGWRLEAHLARAEAARRTLRNELAPSVLEILRSERGKQ